MLLAVLLRPSASAQFIYVANAGEDTVSKIDINTNMEVARYATWFTSGPNHIAHAGQAWMGPAPSRLLEDSGGYLYVLNRFFGAHKPVLLKIAPSGGTPGMPGNAGVTTSGGAGAAAVMPMLDNGTIPNQIDPGDTKDARIVWASEIGTPNAIGRAVCMDPSGFLWVGMWTTMEYFKVDPTTGNPVGAPISVGPPLFGPNTGHRPYGCQVDAKGTLWSTDLGNQLVEINTATNQVKPHSSGDAQYSLSLFNGCGSAASKVYLSAQGQGKPYLAYDPQTTLFTGAPVSTNEQFASISVGVDSQGYIISGQTASSGRVIKSNPTTGSISWDTVALGSTQPTYDLHGIIIDKNDDVWVVSRLGATAGSPGYVIKYNGQTGQHVANATVTLGDSPYTYGNPPPPACPCAQTAEPQIKCRGKTPGGKWLYEWSFVVTNHSPFSAPATSVNISLPNGSPVTDLTPPGNPGQFALTPNLAQNGQATVSGTFTLAQPMPGTKICFDIRLNAGEGWCCPLERVCFVVPDCACASLQGTFRCNHGQRFLDLSVTNLGPTAAQGALIISNTPGVTVSPQNTTLAFPQNTAVTIPSLTVTGATPGQVISLSVMLHGPIDDRTGVFSWCCTATVQVTYPARLCWWWWDGDIFDDVNANGRHDSGENSLPEWTVTLIDAKGTPHTTKSDAAGRYQFEEIEQGKYQVSVQPPKGWRATLPKGGGYSLSVEAPPKGKLDFGFVKTR